MILTIYILISAISITFLYFGFSLDDTIFKVLGFGLMSLVFIGSIGGIEYTTGSINEICSPIINNFEDTYVYGNNLTGYHWDYNDDDAPSTKDNIYLFHVQRENNYTTFCYNETSINTNDQYESKTIFIILSVFAIFGALLFPYLEHKNWSD